MAQSRALYPGPAMHAFFRDTLGADPAIDPPTADRLAEACARPIARMWVTAVPAAPVALGPDAHASAPPVPQPAAHLDPGGVDDVLPWAADLAAGLEQTQAGMEAIAPWPEDAFTDAPEPEPAFDPYAFSAVALLTRSGRDALAARLFEIAAPRDLLAMAEAQHLDVPDTARDAEAIRAAMLASAEARLASRRAAAS